MKAYYPGIMLALAGALFAPCASSQSRDDQGNQGGAVADSLSRYTSASCPITKPSDSSFVPPVPYPAEAPTGGFFFGTPKLWALLWVDWQGGTNSGNKTVWWSEGYNGKTDPQPKLLVTGQRLNTNDAPVVVTDHGNGAWIEGRPNYFITASMPFPSAGCWQVTARLSGAELKFVVWLDNATPRRIAATPAVRDLPAAREAHAESLGRSASYREATSEPLR